MPHARSMRTTPLRAMNARRAFVNGFKAALVRERAVRDTYAPPEPQPRSGWKRFLCVGQQVGSGSQS